MLDSIFGPVFFTPVPLMTSNCCGLDEVYMGTLEIIIAVVSLWYVDVILPSCMCEVPLARDPAVCVCGHVA